MNFELQTPEHVISLASSGMIVNVDVNVWSATKQDRAITNEVINAYKADQNSGRFTKNLLANHPTHKSLVNYRQTVSNDDNVHQTIRSAISHAMRSEVYILVCNETILDVYANKDTAEYEMRLCIQGDLLDGETTTNYSVLIKQLNHTRL